MAPSLTRQGPFPENGPPRPGCSWTTVGQGLNRLAHRKAFLPAACASGAVSQNAACHGHRFHPPPGRFWVGATGAGSIGPPPRATRPAPRPHRAPGSPAPGPRQFPARATGRAGFRYQSVAAIQGYPAPHPRASRRSCPPRPENWPRRGRNTIPGPGRHFHSHHWPAIRVNSDAPLAPVHRCGPKPST